jgi:hypothetical protein
LQLLFTNGVRKEKDGTLGVSGSSDISLKASKLFYISSPSSIPRHLGFLALLAVMTDELLFISRSKYTKHTDSLSSEEWLREGQKRGYEWMESNSRSSSAFSFAT